MPIRTKRAYEPPDSADGARYLVDGLWPRGVTKDALALRGWLRELAPSPTLRRWYGHDPLRFTEFRRRYRDELKDREDSLRPLRTESRVGVISIVYAARDLEHSNAGVLAEYLRERRTRRGSGGSDRARTSSAGSPGDIAQITLASAFRRRAAPTATRR